MKNCNRSLPDDELGNSHLPFLVPAITIIAAFIIKHHLGRFSAQKRYSLTELVNPSL